MNVNKYLKDKKSVVVISLIVFFTLSFILRFLALNQTPFVNGWDGYFYLVQVKSLMEEGSMHSSDLSLIYPLIISLKWITNNYELSFKITSAILAGGFSVCMFHLANKWSKNIFVAIFIGSFTLFSPHLTYFTSQYAKNLLGVIFFLLFLSSIDATKKRIPIALLILNIFGHRVTLVLSVLFGGLHLFLKKSSLKVLIVSGVIASIFIALSIFIPGILNLSDIERFNNEFSNQLQFAPASFLKSFEDLINNYWSFEIYFVCAIYFIALFYLIYLAIKKKATLKHFLLMLISTLLIFPFFRWSLQGFGYRLFLVFVLLIPVLLVFFKDVYNKYVLLVMSLLLIGFSFFSYKSYDPQKFDPPYKSYDHIGKMMLKYAESNNIELIIGHKSMAEIITYKTGIDVMPWIPEYEIQPEKLWRIATDIRYQEIKYYLAKEDLNFVYRLDINYFLIREDLWQKTLKNIIQKDNDRELFEHLQTWKNPFKIRPKYLSKDKH